MYRKKLMRACLTGLMVVTVATANVAPVFAADTAATESKEAKQNWNSNLWMRENVTDDKNVSFMRGFTIMQILKQYFLLDMKENREISEYRGWIEVTVMQKHL